MAAAKVPDLGVLGSGTGPDPSGDHQRTGLNTAWMDCMSST